MEPDNGSDNEGGGGEDMFSPNNGSRRGQARGGFMASAVSQAALAQPMSFRVGVPGVPGLPPGGFDGDDVTWPREDGILAPARPHKYGKAWTEAMFEANQVLEADPRYRFWYLVAGAANTGVGAMFRREAVQRATARANQLSSRAVEASEAIGDAWPRFLEAERISAELRERSVRGLLADMADPSVMKIRNTFARWSPAFRDAMPTLATNLDPPEDDPDLAELLPGIEQSAESLQALSEARAIVPAVYQPWADDAVPRALRGDMRRAISRVAKAGRGRAPISSDHIKVMILVLLQDGQERGRYEGSLNAIVGAQRGEKSLVQFWVALRDSVVAGDGGGDDEGPSLTIPRGQFKRALAEADRAGQRLLALLSADGGNNEPDGRFLDAANYERLTNIVTALRLNNAALTISGNESDDEDGEDTVESEFDAIGVLEILSVVAESLERPGKQAERLRSIIDAALADDAVPLLAAQSHGTGLGTGAGPGPRPGWALQPQFTGQISLSAPAIAGLNNARADVDQFLPGLIEAVGGLENLQGEPIVSQRFANLVANRMLESAISHPRQWYLEKAQPRAERARAVAVGQIAQWAEDVGLDYGSRHRSRAQRGWRPSPRDVVINPNTPRPPAPKPVQFSGARVGGSEPLSKRRRRIERVPPGGGAYDMPWRTLAATVSGWTVHSIRQAVLDTMCGESSGGGGFIQ